MRRLVIGAAGIPGTETVRFLSRDHEVIGAGRKGCTLTMDITGQAASAASSPR